MDEQLKSYTKTLGERIKAARKQRGISNKKLIIDYGIHDSQWRRYERGGGISFASLLRIASVLDMTPSDLLQGIPLPDWKEPTVLRETKEVPRSPRPSELAKRQLQVDRET
ncbi:helix-turn-helix domain-containing protein [Granulicella tundricola]|uniref:Helix-turn-helix domain protein n=1 Tax=Granulicella tundricola (strain ATCC BAA-1859 / DSM 23138 / MP5ACTX9) TaxID=1198114 RepID=E8X197_GRATM|nr:helix-turn-helix transcriptional regulator [Granulicella tundricola]ADW69051.1 helix-turn-helix domain protein [Granulicella tundricola MP5ACTX9]